MNEEFMQFLQSLPPEQQQKMMAQMQGGGGGGPPEMPPAPGMAPPPGMPPQQPPQQPTQQPGDPRMGMPGQNPDMFADYQGQAGVIGDQQAQAEQLRGSQMNPGMNTNAGFVAANPLSAIATGVNKFKGAMDAADALQAKKDLSALKTKTQQGVAQEVFDRNKQAKQAQVLRGNSPLQRMAKTQELNPQMGA